MTTSQAVPLTLQNGIYLQTREYDYTTHLDSAHLMRMESSKSLDTTDLGMITPWITTGYMERPGMWDLIGQGKNRLLHSEGHIYKWQQPIAEQPTYIIEDVSGVDKPGIDGTTFKIKLNKRTFGNSAIITANKFGGVELYVTSDEIRRDGDGFLYTVRLNTTNKKAKYFPKELLQAGTIFFQIGSVLGEYGQTYNDVGNFSNGYREFYNYVGEGFANAHFTVTREAALSRISQKCVIGLQNYRKIIEMYQLRPGSAAYDISRQGQSPVSVYMDKGMSAKQAAEAVKADIVKKAWIPEVEMLAKRMVERDVENYAMWGAGGVLDVEGATQVRLPIGLFHQLNMGPTYNYNIPNFQLRKLDAWVTSRLKDKIDPYGQNKIVIGTGLGGLKLVRGQILDTVMAMGLTFEHDRYVKGNDNQMLYFDGPNFISYRMSFGIVEFKHVPALDPIAANEIENPMIEGHRLSSYMFIIDDLTASNDNIHEIVYGPDFDFHHFYINGRMNYLDNPAYGTSRSGPYQASNTGAGFEVYIEKRLKAYWIKDLTKSLLIKPYNPYTGKPLFEPYYM
jgi:hypothetical protein